MPPDPAENPRGETADEAAWRERTLADVTVVVRAQDQDLDAFSELVRRYEAELQRLAYRMLSDRGDAQDVIQDTWLLVWRKLPTLVEPQAFHGWIYHIATRQCLNRLRTRTRRRTDVGATDDFESEVRSASTVGGGSVVETPSDAAESSARLHSLDQALAAVPPQLRACWVLKELHDLSYTEISYALGIPISTVRGRLARARRLLAQGMTSWR